MNFGSVRGARVKHLWGVGGGLILETNCIFEYKPPLYFRLDVMYRVGGGGVLTGHYGTSINKLSKPLQLQRIH